MVRSDNELESLHIHLPKHIFIPLGMHIFETREGHSIDRILHHGGISPFVVNLSSGAILCKHENLQYPHTKAMKYQPSSIVH